MTITRTPGQSPMLPGTVSTNGFAFTSGIVSPSALAGTGPVAVEVQIAETLAQLVQVLADAGTTPERVVKIDAFLASASDFAAWNEGFLRLWPTPGPARTTLVVGFANPAVLFELNAIAAL
jgi:2-iminobutanoate/2-iminopropanoate deaminase